MKEIIDIEINENCNLTIEQVSLLSKKEAILHLSKKDEFRELIEKGENFLKQKSAIDSLIYGVNTGYGENCDRKIPVSLVEELPSSLVHFHGCGLGDFLTIEQTRAVLAIRLTSLCRGYSG